MQQKIFLGGPRRSSALFSIRCREAVPRCTGTAPCVKVPFPSMLAAWNWHEWQRAARVVSCVKSCCSLKSNDDWTCSCVSKFAPVIRLRMPLKFLSATMFEAAVGNFGLLHNFELPTVIADGVPRANCIFSLASVAHVTGHMVSHMVPIAQCRPPCWKIRTENNLVTVF